MNKPTGTQDLFTLLAGKATLLTTGFNEPIPFSKIHREQLLNSQPVSETKNLTEY